MIELQVNRFIVLVLTFCGLAVFAQQNDARLWLKAGVEKKLNRKLNLQIDACTRVGENMSRLESYYVAVGLEYKVLKKLKLGAALRHSGKREISPYYDERNRISLWLAYKRKIYKNWGLAYRPMYQQQYTNMLTSEDGYIPSKYLRNKVSVYYDLHKKYTPYVTCELFYQSKYFKGEFNRVRYETGIDYEFNRKHKINVFYLLQREFNEPNPIRSYIIGLGYKFVL